MRITRLYLMGVKFHTHNIRTDMNQNENHVTSVEESAL